MVVPNTHCTYGKYLYSRHDTKISYKLKKIARVLGNNFCMGMQKTRKLDFYFRFREKSML